MPTKRATSVSVGFRLDPALLERLDRHCERMAQLVPGLRFARVDALRSLLTDALDRAEVAAGEAPGKSRPRRR